MKKILSLILFMIILTACTPKPNEIKIGWTGPLTGDIAIVGTENLRGAQIAIDEINEKGGIQGIPVSLMVEDDQLDDKKMVTAYNKFTQVDGIKNILSVTYGGILSLASKADSDKVIIINSLDTSEEMANAGDYTFAVGIYDEGIGYKLSDYASKIGIKQVGMIYNNVDPFVLLVADAFTKKYQELGGTVAITEKYEPDQYDFRTQITKIKDSGVDTVVVIGYDEAGIALKQAKDLGLNAKILAIDTVLSEGFKKNAGPAYEGIYFTNWEPADEQIMVNFAERYKQKYHEEPQQLLFAACGYDAMKVLAEAMQKSNLEQESIKTEMYGTNNYRGLTGTLSMSPDGIVRSVQEEIYQIQNGQPVKV